MAGIAANLEIETRRMQNDIDSLKGHLKAMRQTSEKMMANINALSAMWEGPAKSAFTAQFQSDYATLRSMADVIDTLIGNLEYAREQYDKCENNIASIINAIRV